MFNQLILLIYLLILCWFWISVGYVWKLKKSFDTLQKHEKLEFKCFARQDKVITLKRFSTIIVGSTLILPLKLMLAIAMFGIHLLLIYLFKSIELIIDYNKNFKTHKKYWLGNIKKIIYANCFYIDLKIFGLGKIIFYRVESNDLCFASNEDTINYEKLNYYEMNSHEIAKLKYPTTYISNHVSFLDVFLTLYLFYPSFCSKQSIKNLLLIGDHAKDLNCLFINFQLKSNRMNILQIISERQKALWKLNTLMKFDINKSLLQNHVNWITSPENNIKSIHFLEFTHLFQSHMPSYDLNPLMIYPEGTTSNNLSLLEFKKGAFISMKSILPFFIVYDFEIFSPAYDVIPMFYLIPLLLGLTKTFDLKLFFCPEQLPSIQEVIEQNHSSFTNRVFKLMNSISYTVFDQKNYTIHNTIQSKTNFLLKLRNLHKKIA